MDADKLPLGELREYLSSVSDRELLEIILSTWKCRAPEETAENLMNSHTTFADALTAETTDEKTATALRLIPALSSAFIQSGGSNCLNSTGSAMEHFRQQRELSFYAGSLCISVHYLCEAVFVCGGHYPKHYIRQALISEAKYLLAYTPQSAAAISEELGLPNPAWFSRLFKRETGLTPGAFRRQFRRS